MNCHEFESRIQMLLDDRRPLAGDGELAAHAMQCPACEEMLSTYEYMLRATSRLPKVQPSAQFASRVVTQAQGGGLVDVAPTTRGSRRNWYVALAAIAALLLLAVGVGTFANRNRPDGEIAIAQPNDDRQPQIVGLGTPGRVIKAGDTQVASAELPGGSSVDGPEALQPVVAPPEVEVASTFPIPTVTATNPEPGYFEYRWAFHSFASQLPEAVGRIESVEQYAPSIRPIRETFSAAFGTLLKTIPGRSDQNEMARPQARMGSGLIDVA